MLQERLLENISSTPSSKQNRKTLSNVKALNFCFLEEQIKVKLYNKVKGFQK